MSNEHQRRKCVASSEASKSESNSLDWDSPSTKTGTVKRRPNSSDCYPEFDLKDYYDGKAEIQNQHHIKDYQFRRQRCIGEKIECRDNALRENYFGDFLFYDVSRKSGSSRKGRRSVSVYEPPPPIRGFNGDEGQVGGEENGLADHLTSSSNIESTARRIKVLSLDASQERIRSIHNFVQNKYVVYKKDKADASRKCIPVYHRDFPGKCALERDPKELQARHPESSAVVRILMKGLDPNEIETATIDAVDVRLRKCLETNGQHFKH